MSIETHWSMIEYWLLKVTINNISVKHVHVMAHIDGGPKKKLDLQLGSQTIDIL